MKFISWNVNGLRAIFRKGFSDIFKDFDADFVCLQETKLSPGVETPEFEGYESFWNLADRKGYSGTAIYARHKPLAATCGIGDEEHDHEGRVITLEYADFYLVTVYTPNSNSELTRLHYREKWDEAFRAYVVGLDARKPVIICGDFNAIHQPVDARNFDEVKGSACATDTEREGFQKLLDSGFVDTFRQLHPHEEKAYTWWSYMMQARRRNIGWRIDCFLISRHLVPQLTSATILCEVQGSDHCPIEMTLD